MVSDPFWVAGAACEGSARGHKFRGWVSKRVQNLKSQIATSSSEGHGDEGTRGRGKIPELDGLGM